MKAFKWSESKNASLLRERNVSFAMVVTALAQGKMLTIVSGKENYAHQRQFAVNINGYPYAVPFVEDEHHSFLKMIFPNRKFKHLIQL